MWACDFKRKTIITFVTIFTSIKIDRFADNRINFSNRFKLIHKRVHVIIHAKTSLSNKFVKLYHKQEWKKNWYVKRNSEKRWWQQQTTINRFDWQSIEINRYDSTRNSLPYENIRLDVTSTDGSAPIWLRTAHRYPIDWAKCTNVRLKREWNFVKYVRNASVIFNSTYIYTVSLVFPIPGQMATVTSSAWKIVFELR